MTIKKVFDKMVEDKDWEEFQLAKTAISSGYGMYHPDSIKNKSDLERKIDDFSTQDGLRLISNSERKKLIEEEVKLNIKKK